MTNPKSAAWYIDALDARAGMAFAANRFPCTESEPIGELETTGVFISAPDFSPVHVASRTLALSATRRSFQTGFYISDEEVPFATIVDVAEFVRRLYLRGGGEDGPDRGGAGVPPLPPAAPNGGNTPPGPRALEQASAPGDPDGIDVSGGSPKDRALVRPTESQLAAQSWFQKVQEQIAALAAAAQKGADESGAIGLATPIADGAGAEARADIFNQALHRAGEALILELRKRWPQAPERSRWVYAADGLIEALERLGRFRFLAQSLGALEIPHDSGRRALGTDSFDLLELLPVPSSTCSQWALGEESSLLDVLSAFFGTPVVDPATLDLVLFASALIVVSSSRKPEPLDTVQIAAVLEWLGKQLPRRLYAQSIEAALRRPGTSVS
jgi:hypothetical protein